MKKIEIEIKEIKLENGKTFNSVTAYQKDGKKIRAHFRKEVNNLPKECGRYFMNCEEKDLSVNKSKKYPELWVAKIASVEDYEKVENETAQKIVNDLFSDAE